jgi:hypothetical protein
MLGKQMSDVAHSEGLRKVRHPKRGPASRMRAERRLKEAPLTLRSIDRHSVMRPRKSQREATAYHEAGHAVIAHALGRKASKELKVAVGHPPRVAAANKTWHLAVATASHPRAYRDQTIDRLDVARSACG